MYNGSSDRYHPENKLTDTQQSPADECGGGLKQPLSCILHDSNSAT